MPTHDPSPHPISPNPSNRTPDDHLELARRHTHTANRQAELGASITAADSYRRAATQARAAADKLDTLATQQHDRHDAETSRHTNDP